MQGFIYNLSHDKYKGFVPAVLKLFLFLLSLVYGAIIRFLIFFNGLKPKRLNCKVISVGNITVGGTGKTSLVELICRHLKQNGHKVAILSRGYRRKVRSPEPGVQSYENMGDEPYMLAKKLADTPVVVDANRIRAAAKAMKDYSADTVVLDDGFQQWRIHKDLEIVAIDSTGLFGNRNMLPRGVLREPLSSLRRADIFVLTKTNLNSDTAGLKKELNSINPSAEIFEAAHKACGFYPLVFQGVGVNKLNCNYALLDAGSFKGKSAALFSGIGDPDSFENLIRSLGINIALHLRFPDHHYYTAKDLNRILSACKEKGIKEILTTEKDASRLSCLRFPMQDEECQLFILRIEVALAKDEQRFFNRLRKLYPV
jgi:tetraacyldisaccharide 4'-kinase